MKYDKEDEALKLLRGIRSMTHLINELQEQVTRLYTSLTSTTIRLKELDVQTSGDDDPLGNKMSDIVEYQYQIVEYQRQLSAKRKLALDIVKTMELKYQPYILTRYFNDKTIEQIAEEQDKSYRWTWEMLHEAEEEFIEKYRITS